MTMPKCLKSEDLLIPPQSIVDLCTKKGVLNVYFVDKAGFNQSLREDDEIFINTRCTFWANYILPPWNARSVGETILLRTLHEVGHVVHNHPGDVIETDDNQLIKPQVKDFWKDTLSDIEGEAWDIAFQFRRHFKIEYNKLVSVCDTWAKQHNYINKDWNLNYNKQFKNTNGYELSKARVPKWIKEKYPN